jgi:hypothetical protein
MATIDELLAGFGEATVGEKLAIDPRGVCELGFHGTRRLTLEPEPGSDKVHLYGTIARLPGQNAETVYGKLLTANLYGKGADEAYFAVDPMRESIVLNRVLTTGHLDVEAFGELLTGFMDAVEHWSRELDTPDFAEREDEPDAAPSRDIQADPRRSGDIVMIRG